MRDSIRVRIAGALALAALMVVPGSARQQQQPAAPEPGQQPARPAEGVKPVDETVAAEPVDPHTYVIGPEDQLMIRVWRERDVSGAVIVRPDGKITLPLIGDVQAGGRTPEQLRKEVTEKLSEFLNRPEVMVAVTAVRSKKYYIVGQVNRTGSFPLVVPTTVLEALSNAGGFQQWANRKKIVILRGNKRLKFNYNDVIKGKHMEQNIYLQNGDHIIVP